MPIAHGLADTKGEMEVVFVRSTAALAKVIRQRKRKCATTADDNGAINIWIDDNGHYRGESMRHLRSLELTTFRTVREMQAWYRKWLKKVQ